MVKKYVPERGDLVWAHLGHEQAGHRPALIISPREYNAKTGLALMCPVTSKSKGYPFEVKLCSEIKGIVLSDQIKSFDWKATGAKYICRVSNGTIRDVLAKLNSLIS